MRTLRNRAMRITGNSLGVAPSSELLYGVTIGPIIEEVIYRGAAFSVIYISACSVAGLATAHSPGDRSQFPALRVVTHQGDGSAVATDLCDGRRVCTYAVAIELNRHRCCDAHYIQRSHCTRNAATVNPALALRVSPHAPIVSIAAIAVQFDRVSILPYTHGARFPRRNAGR
jgi:hypothetical protein